MARALSQVIGIDQQSGKLVEVAADGTLKGATPGGSVALAGQINSGQIASGQLSGINFANLNTTITVDSRVLCLEQATKIIEKAWQTLCHSKTTQDRMWVIGHIEAFHDLKILNETEYKGWLLKIDLCPGHTPDFNPADCAYCLPKV